MFHCSTSPPLPFSTSPVDMEELDKVGVEIGSIIYRFFPVLVDFNVIKLYNVSKLLGKDVYAV